MLNDAWIIGCKESSSCTVEAVVYIPAGFYPSILRIEHPPKVYTKVLGGAMESDASPARLKFFDRTKGKHHCTVHCVGAAKVISVGSDHRMPVCERCPVRVQDGYSYTQRLSTLIVASFHQAGWCTQTSQRLAKCT